MCSGQIRVFAILIVTFLIFTNFNNDSFIGADQPDTSEEIILVFTGDIMIGRSVGSEIVKNNDPYHPFHSIGEFTQRGDITYGNLETTVSKRGEPLDKKYVFRADPETLSGVKDAGFDILTIANNHIRDYGPDATEDTLKYIEEYGMDHVGLWYLNENAINARIPRPVVLEAKGVRFAFLGYAENPSSSFLASETVAGPVPDQESIMKADIKYARTIADIVVVSIHWARLPQYVKTADSGQIEMCHRLCDWGADILANHGPHVLQEVELYNNSLIFYSLGNTVFDLSNTSSHYSMLARLHLTGKNFHKLELIPIVKNKHHQYIAQGNILEVDVKAGLNLDWTDYNLKMFNVDTLLTDYSEPKSDHVYSVIPAAIIPIGLLIFAVLAIILLIMLWKRKRE